MYLDGPSANKIIAVIGLLDLYGPTLYPDTLTTAQERVDWAVRELENRVDNKRFKMFFAVHGVEAWLLCNPDLFPPSIRQALPGKVQHPESVNFDESPAKLLERLYREKEKRKYKKVVDGNSLFSQLSPDLAYQKCPNFRTMMDNMLALAKAAGL